MTVYFLLQPYAQLPRCHFCSTKNSHYQENYRCSLHKIPITFFVSGHPNYHVPDDKKREENKTSCCAFRKTHTLKRARTRHPTTAFINEKSHIFNENPDNDRQGYLTNPNRQSGWERASSVNEGEIKKGNPIGRQSIYYGVDTSRERLNSPLFPISDIA